jgi:hypothetical protein
MVISRLSGEFMSFGMPPISFPKSTSGRNQRRQNVKSVTLQVFAMHHSDCKDKIVQ